MRLATCFSTRRRIFDHLLKPVVPWPPEAMASAVPVENRWYPRHWCLRSEVTRLLSNHESGDDRYLLPDLARLVANYLPDTIILWGTWTTAIDSETLQRSPVQRVQACAWRMVSDFDVDDVVCLYDAVPKCSEVVWPPSNAQRSVIHEDACVDHKRHVGYVLQLCDDDSRFECRLWGIDLAVGRCRPVLIPKSGSDWDQRFGLSTVILNDSLWIIGKRFHNKGNTSENQGNDYPNIMTMRYDLSSDTWDSALNPIVGLAPIQFAAYVEISHTLAVVSGGYVGKSKTAATHAPGERIYSDSCYLLEEQQNTLGVRTLGVKQQLPRLFLARAEHGMAFIPDISAIVAIEGTIQSDSSHTPWTRAAEILSLLPLKRNQRKLMESEPPEPPEPWCWRGLPTLPIYLANASKRVFGVGDNIIALSKLGLYRLRVCGDCAARICTRVSHTDDYHEWHRLPAFPLEAQQHSIAFFSIRDSNFS
jgi:hypothetical protein